MKYIKQQVELFLTALGFFSRIPIPYKLAFSQDNLNRCNRYFPLVGLVIGGIGAGIYLTAALILPQSVSILLSMAATILATGAFHEDGFADVCDGFGGGWTKERILIIMKDSRVGAYGAIGMMVLLMTKFQALNEIAHSQVALSLIVAHVLSRSTTVTSMYSLNYVREDESSKSKPITKSIHLSDTLIAMLFGLISLVLFLDITVFLILIPIFLTKYILERYFIKWIGGYTGDCLGSIQQVCEVVIYLSLLVYFKYQTPELINTTLFNL